MTNPLPIPNPLLADWTAPAGDWTAPAQVNVNASCHVDLTLARITGTGGGFLFKPKSGVSMDVELGEINSLAGIVLGLVGAGGLATVRLHGGLLTNVVALINYKSNDGGRLNGALYDVEAHGVGVGVRTYGSAEAYDSTLIGGGNPSTGEPCGVRGLDLNSTGTPVEDQFVIVRNCDIHDFVVGSNPDLVGGEETVSWMSVTDSRLSNVGDAAVDSKARDVLVADNHLYGSYGIRMVDSHIGRLVSAHNVFDVPAGVYALQASSGYGSDPTNPNDPGLLSMGDTFNLLDPTAMVARALVACQGSTGFTGTRCGCIRVIDGHWGSRTNVMVHPDGVCGGVLYHPQVITG